MAEALHQVTIVMSNRGIPASYRHMHGFGSHTFSFINAKRECHWIKFHFKCWQVIKNLTDAEAEAVIGKDRESHQRDLYDAIERGDYPKWTLHVQIVPEKDAAKVPYHPFDLTKVWPHKDYPLIEVGVMELNRNPANFFAEVEQSAFNPANVVPGIGFSPDKLLAADHWNHREDQDYYSQPGAQFRLMTTAQQKLLFENTGRSIGAAPREIQIRHIRNCLKADPAYGKGVADAWVSSDRCVGLRGDY